MDAATQAYLGFHEPSIKMWSKVPPASITTGFCEAGLHEGKRPKDREGRPLRTCPFWEACNCKCHADLNELYKMTDTPRVLVENPEYMPLVNTFWMPSPEDYASVPEAAPDVDEKGGVLVAPKVVAVTPTGRTNRGGLEYLVQRECLLWLDQPAATHCTPRYLSDEIARTEKMKAPSLGAVDAVLKRWVACGYAIVEKSPTRFVGLTEEGRAKGLEHMKALAKKR